MVYVMVFTMLVIFVYQNTKCITLIVDYLITLLITLVYMLCGNMCDARVYGAVWETLARKWLNHINVIILVRIIIELVC